MMSHTDYLVQQSTEDTEARIDLNIKLLFKLRRQTILKFEIKVHQANKDGQLWLCTMNPTIYMSEIQEVHEMQLQEIY